MFSKRRIQNRKLIRNINGRATDFFSSKHVYFVFVLGLIKSLINLNPMKNGR